MRVLVTGGSGYVGSHALRELTAAGHEAIVYDNFSTGFRFLSKGYPVVVGDIADTALLAEHLEDVDAVMHFAASAYVGESTANPRKYFKNNVESALLLLDAVLASPVRKFVFSSTCAVYGSPAQLPIEESSPREPINPYGATKLFFERVLRAYSDAHGLRSVSLRYFNAAGAHAGGEIGELHDPETHLIPLALRAALGTAPPLTVFGSDLPTPDGTCIRDYVHVTDLGRAHVKALDYLADGGETTALNLGTGRGVSILELMAAIRRTSGLEVPHTFAPPRQGDPAMLYAQPARAKQVLDWTAEHEIDSIVSSAMAWERTLGLVGNRK
jgi:UDP-glucose-4-epimerase GalE